MDAVADSETEETIAKGLVELVADEVMMVELLDEGAAEDEGGSDQVDEEDEGGGGLQVDEGVGSTHSEVEVVEGGGGVHVEVGGVQVEVGGVQVEVGVGEGEGEGC